MSDNDPKRTQERDAPPDAIEPGTTEAEAQAAAEAQEAARQRTPTAAEAEPGPLERPEVMAGIVFGGAFVLARILKRLVD